MDRFARNALSLLMMATSLFSIGLAPGRGFAQTQNTSCIVTTGGTKEALDVTFLLECSSAESNGVLHFRVQPSIVGPSVSDRELTIVLTLQGSPYDRSATRYRTKLQLKEGAVAATGDIPIAKCPTGESSGMNASTWNVAIYEDQRNIETSRAIQAGFGSTYKQLALQPDESPPPLTIQLSTPTNSALAILEDGVTEFNVNTMQILMAHRIAGDAPFPPVGGSAPISILKLARDNTRTMNYRHLDSLPDAWHYYIQYQSVTLSEKCLLKLCESKPKAAQAIRQFVAAGGNLIVSDAQQGMVTLDRWLLNRPEIEKGAAPDWEDLEELTKPPLPVDSETQSPIVTADKRDWSNSKAATRKHVLGRVICLNEGHNHYIRSIIPHLAPAVGLSSSSSHDGGWSLRNMIASVGKPPVWTFCAIVLLFGMVLGPGLLVLTGWIGRRSLMILLVPLVSIVATLSIVSYEVLHNGFRTYARLTSVLSIDEASGDAFVWSRQNYFSGWPPREGLTFPNEVFSRNVNGSHFGRWGVRQVARNETINIDHGPKETTWLGALPAREQRQFLLGHPAKLAMPIKVKRIDDSRASLRNLTDEMLPFVVLRDGGSGYYFAENVAPGEELELSRLPFDDLGGSFSRLRSASFAAMPADLRGMGWNTATDMSAIEVIDQNWAGSLSELSQTSNIEPYGFVTMIRKCDEVFVPLKTNVRESLHLVTGSAVW